METFLATYGKPRFLGIVKLEESDYDSVKKLRLAVVSSHRGKEFAELVGRLNEEQESAYRKLRSISEHGEGPIRGGDLVVTDLNFLRPPDEEDFLLKESHDASERESLLSARELAVWHKLPIKLIDAEILLDEKKLFFYFTSEQRVDFRTLVKDLARKFKTRIELRQMGVRDEARIIRGISSCGLPCCCSYWLNQFAPIGIKMVKEQNIALNPTKISGICGRLMCCMGFEHRTYKDLWTGLPGPGSRIKTPNGNYVVLSMDIVKNEVFCHRPMGGDISVPVKLFGEFRRTVMEGGEWEPPEKERPEERLRADRCADCRARSANSFKETMSALPAAESDKTSVRKEKKGEKAPKKRSSRRRSRRNTRESDGSKAEKTSKDLLVGGDPRRDDGILSLTGAVSPACEQRSTRHKNTPKTRQIPRMGEAERQVPSLEEKSEERLRLKPRRRRRRRSKRVDDGNTPPEVNRPAQE